jgi:hypothetical protein
MLYLYRASNNNKKASNAPATVVQPAANNVKQPGPVLTVNDDNRCNIALHMTITSLQLFLFSFLCEFIYKNGNKKGKDKVLNTEAKR